MKRPTGWKRTDAQKKADWERVEPSRWEKFTAEPRTRQQVEAWVKKNVHSAYVPEEGAHQPEGEGVRMNAHVDWQKAGYMRFEDIGEELGISGAAAQLIYKQALKKLRDEQALEQFAELVRLRRAIQQRQQWL